MTLYEDYQLLLKKYQQLKALVIKLQSRIEELEEKLRNNSQNSSQPPSQDKPSIKKNQRN